MVPIVYIVWSNTTLDAIQWNQRQLTDVEQHVVCSGPCTLQNSETYEIERYQHHSINTFAYEKRCFERFGVLLKFMRRRNITKAVHVDADIFIQSRTYYDAMVRHELALVRKVHRPYATTDASTYFVVLTRGVLAAFVRYMEIVLQDAGEVHRVATRHGVSVKHCCPYYKGRRTMHLSDMQLFMAFVHAQRLTPAFAPPLNTVERVDCARTIRCGRKPMLHFQGACKRKIAAFARSCHPHPSIRPNRSWLAMELSQPPK